MTDPAPYSAPKPAASVTIILEEPIVRGETSIERLTLRPARSGELRGINMRGLVNADVDAVLMLLPRITDPFLTDAEIDNLSSPDFAEIAGVITGFLYTAAQKAQIRAMTGS